jgi:hypothetical protein
LRKRLKGMQDEINAFGYFSCEILNFLTESEMRNSTQMPLHPTKVPRPFVGSRSQNGLN